MSAHISSIAVRPAWRKWASHTVRPWVKRLYGRLAPVLPPALRTRWKHQRELGFWNAQLAQGQNDEQADLYYRKLMLAVAGEADDTFLAGKIVADFGCGPRGSLNWALSAAQRIGIDVLADAYAPLGIRQHRMTYVCSSEAVIPLPSNYVDVLWTVNALDHVSNLRVMCRELLRILAPGGTFIASLNLDEPPSLCEPQRLDERTIRALLLAELHVDSYRIAPQGPPENIFAHFSDGTAAPSAPSSGPRYLWLRATKPAQAAR